MKKTIYLSIFLALLAGLRLPAEAVAAMEDQEEVAQSEIIDYQNYNRGYQPGCDGCDCPTPQYPLPGAPPPCSGTSCAPPPPPPPPPCVPAKPPPSPPGAPCDEEPCAAECGAQCGLSMCALGLGLAALAAVGAIIISANGGTAQHLAPAGSLITAHSPK